MRRPVAEGLPIVVKVGSSSITAAHGGVDPEAIAHIVDEIAEVRRRGHPVVLVSSGAVAAGLPVLGLDRRPDDLPGLQAAAAVGQGRLVERYASRFAAAGFVVGQVLLTRDVLARRQQYLHARATLERLLALGAVPIVNENDTVAVDELRFGDNDRLAALVSHLVGAGILVILSDTAGLYTEDPRLVEDAELLTAVAHTDEILDELRRRAGAGRYGSGGVATKVAAARMAAFSGIPTVVASADEAGVVAAAVAGEEIGTWVEPRPDRLPARKLWIAFGQPAVGRLAVDDGAVRALAGGGASLLAVGVVDVEGDFEAGDAVEVLDGRGRLVAKGLVAMDAATVRAVAGSHSTIAGGEVVHRDDLVVLV
ncbi:MAG TPA: glutamate 5-kinase [Actinobacteria bacterium]|nr:glutamate 5-kinase [Actinomycetota bacterium]